MKSKQTIKNERIFSQTQDMLAKTKENHEQLIESQRNKSSKALMESAYATAGLAARNSRLHTEERVRRLGYPEHFTQLALSEALGYACDKALLLDADEYAKLEPDYKNKMRSTIRSFLENGDINVDPKAKVTQDLLVEIGKCMPDAKQFLKEDDEKEIVNDKVISNPVINRELDALAGDIRRRVANRIQQDQVALAVQQDDIENAKDKEAQAAPLVPAPIPDATTGLDPMADAPVADPDSIQPTDVPSADVPAEQPAPVKTESLNIAREKRTRGVLDTLALNEGMDMVKNGQAYNADHALANAIRYVTCLEALDSSELVFIGTPGYNRILSKYGASMNPGSRTDIPFADVKSDPIGTVPAVASKDGTPDDLAAHDDLMNSLPATDDAEKSTRSELSDIIKSAFPKGMMVQTDSGLFKPYSEWESEHHIAKPVDVKAAADSQPVVQESVEDLTGKYTDIHGKAYTEDELYEYFETQGFYGLNENDFDDLWHSWGFKKH
jgi:hypothetical protein